MKANNNKNSRGKWGLRALLACAASVAMIMSACVRDNLTEGIVKDSSGRTHATLSVDLITPAADEKTRSALDAGQLKIETVWVGVFDTNTGNMVGYFADRPLKDDSTHVTIRDNSGSWTIPGIDIYYYDSNPEVYIVSVANFEFVQARMVGDYGDTTDLSKLLGVKIDEEGKVSVEKYITWDDFRAISVDTGSIKAAAEKSHKSEPDNYPLVMGFFSSDNSRHVTVDRDGNANAAKVQLTEDGQVFGSVIQPQGRIYLRRLVSDITVNINFSTPDVSSSSSNPYTEAVIQEVRSIRYKVINKPVEMYLAEHAVDQSGGSLTGKNNYLSRTANSADWLELNEAGTGYTSDEDWSAPIEGSIADGYSFTYSHYENKHWGVDYNIDGAEFGYTPDGRSLSNFGYYDETRDTYVYIDSKGKSWKEYFDELFLKCGYVPVYVFSNLIHATASHRLREAKMEVAVDDDQPDDEEVADPVFKALCNEEASFNNNASYFLIEADMTWKTPSDGSLVKGKFYYTVHEGYTSHADGSAVNEPSKAGSKSDIYDAICDFQTVRNTKYTYNLTFSGINTLMMQVSRDLRGDNTMHDDGLGGEVWYSGGIVNVKPEGFGDQYYYNSNIDSWIYRFPYNGNSSEFVLYGAESMEARNLITWRLYSKTPDGDFNAGTFNSTDQFDWPEIKGTTYTLEQFKALDDDDPMKQLYNSFKIHVGPACNPNDYSFDSNFGVYGGYSYFYSLKEMTIDEFLEGADSDIVRIYTDRLYWFVTCDEFEVEDDDPNNYNNYLRGMYLVQSLSDDDGCAISGLFAGYQQRPKNIGVAMEYFAPIYLQRQNSWDYEIYNPAYKDFSVYSAVRDFTDLPAFIRWYPGVAEYKFQPEEDLANKAMLEKWASIWQNYGRYSYVHEPLSYTLKITGEGHEPIEEEIAWDDQRYRHTYEQNESTDILGSLYGYYNYTRYGTEYFSYPIDPKEFEPGDYDVVITPHYDDRFVQPVEPIVTKLHIAEKPLWTFDNVTFPQIGYMWRGYYTYNSMTVIGIGSSNNLDSQLLIDNARDGHLNFGASGSSNSGALQFIIDRHGSFRVNVMNNNRDERRLVLSVLYSDKDITYSEYIPSRGSEPIDVWLDTHDIIDDFSEGPVTVSIYAEKRLDIYEVEWIESEYQGPTLSSSKLEYTIQPYFDRSGYSSDGTYIHPSLISYSFHITPGLVNYFGFSDSKPRAETYVMEVFSGSDTTTPLITEEINAAECKVGYDGIRGYFVYPFYVPTGELEPTPNNSYEAPYYIYLTPKADGYMEADRTKMCPMYVCSDEDEVNWWNNNYNHVDGPNNMFYVGVSKDDLKNKKIGWMEYHGLVLHYGTGSMDIDSDWINFGGNGYPLVSKSTPELGRYMSFTTDRPGEVVLTASSTSNKDNYRYFRLYKVVENGVHELVDRSLIGRGRTPFVLSTGPVEDLTEFIICPEGGVNLYSARFIPTGTDHRSSLNTSIIKYSNWSSDPKYLIHPSWYDDEYEVEEGDDDYGYKYKEFDLLRNFASPFAFSDSNPRATEYEIQLYDRETFAESKLDKQPDKTFVVPADDYVTYKGSDGWVFTYPLLLDVDILDESYGEFLAFVKPVGDDTKYKSATPQFIAKICYRDWVNMRYLPDPDDDIFPNYDGEPSEQTQKFFDFMECFMKSQIYDEFDAWENIYDFITTESGKPLPPGSYMTFSKDYTEKDHVEVHGMTLNGAVEFDLQKIENEYHDNSGGVHTSTYYFPWLKLPAQSSAPNSSLSFETNIGGQIVVTVAVDKDNYGENSQLILYKKNSTGGYDQIDSSKIVFMRGEDVPYDMPGLEDADPENPETWPKAIYYTVLDTGHVDRDEMQEFVISSNVDSYLMLNFGSSITFIAEGSPAYEWDLKKNGMPMPGPDFFLGDDDGDDDDDANGYRIMSAIKKVIDRQPASKELKKMNINSRTVKRSVLRK